MEFCFTRIFSSVPAQQLVLSGASCPRSFWQLWLDPTIPTIATTRCLVAPLAKSKRWVKYVNHYFQKNNQEIRVQTEGFSKSWEKFPQFHWNATVENWCLTSRDSHFLPTKSLIWPHLIMFSSPLSAERGAEERHGRIGKTEPQLKSGSF